MASENAKIDSNRKKTLLGVTDDSNAELKRLLVDATTGRLKVSATVTPSSLTTRTEINVASYNTLTTDVYLGVIRPATGTCAIVLKTNTLGSATAPRRYLIKDESGNAGTNNITISTEGAEKIDGLDTFVMSSDYSSYEITSDGVNWYVN